MSTNPKKEKPQQTSKPGQPPKTPANPTTGAKPGSSRPGATPKK